MYQIKHKKSDYLKYFLFSISCFLDFPAITGPFIFSYLSMNILDRTGIWTQSQKSLKFVFVSTYNHHIILHIIPPCSQKRTGQEDRKHFRPM